MGDFPPVMGGAKETVRNLAGHNIISKYNYTSSKPDDNHHRTLLLPAGPLPVPPLPPILVPGLGLLPALKALDLLAPQLTPEEAVYLNQLLELTAALTGLTQSDLDNPPPTRIIQLITSPTEQLRELQSALSAVASGERSGGSSSGMAGRPQVNQQVCLTTHACDLPNTACYYA